MTELQRAVVFLQEARAKIEVEAQFEDAQGRREGLYKAADSIDHAILLLANMGTWDKRYD